MHDVKHCRNITSTSLESCWTAKRQSAPTDNYNRFFKRSDQNIFKEGKLSANLRSLLVIWCSFPEMSCYLQKKFRHSFHSTSSSESSKYFHALCCFFQQIMMIEVSFRGALPRSIYDLQKHKHYLSSLTSNLGATNLIKP